MSLPILFRPIARLEMDEAMGWYQKQKAGLEAEFKDAVDQMLEGIAAAPLRFGPVRAKFAEPCCDDFPTPFTSCLSPTPSSCLPCFTPNGIHATS